MDSGVGVPIGARVKVTDGEQLCLLDDEGKVREERDVVTLQSVIDVSPDWTG